MSTFEEPQRGFMMWEATTLQRHVFKHKLQLGDHHMAILLTANSLIPRFYASNSFQRNSHLVYAAASFLLAQKMHFCSNSIQRIAQYFLDACSQQLDGKHSYLLEAPLQKLHELRSAYITAKAGNWENVAEHRARWEAEHAAISKFLVNAIRMAERKLLITIGFRHLHLIGREWSVFQKIEDTLELHSRAGWKSPQNEIRDVDVTQLSPSKLWPRHVAVQFMLHSACSSRALEKYGPSTVAMAAIKNAVDAKTFHLLDVPEGSTTIATVLAKVELPQKVSEADVSECWKYAVKAHQAQKQELQVIQGPVPSPCHPHHSPTGPTKISPNLSTISSSTPLSTSPNKRCRFNDNNADPSCKAARTESPHTAPATPAKPAGERPRGIPPPCRPEHEHDRRVGARRSPGARASGPPAKKAPPPSPESLEEGELRSP